MAGAAAVLRVKARSSIPETADRLSTQRNVPSSRSQPPAYKISSCSRMPSLPTSTNREYAPASARVLGLRGPPCLGVSPSAIQRPAAYIRRLDT